MLKCHLDTEKDIAMVESCGSIFDTIVDLTYLINDLYNAIRSSDEIVALSFKRVIQKTVAADNSPVWENRESVDGVTSVVLKLPKDFRPGKED